MSSWDLIFKLKQETDKLETVIFQLYFRVIIRPNDVQNLVWWFCFQASVSNLSVSCFNLNIKSQDYVFRSVFYSLLLHKLAPRLLLAKFWDNQAIKRSVKNDTVNAQVGEGGARINNLLAPKLSKRLTWSKSRTYTTLLKVVPHVTRLMAWAIFVQLLDITRNVLF